MDFALTSAWVLTPAWITAYSIAVIVMYVIMAVAVLLALIMLIAVIFFPDPPTPPSRSHDGVLGGADRPEGPLEQPPRR